MSQALEIQRGMVQLVTGGLDLGRLNQAHEDTVAVIQACITALKETEIRTSGDATCPACEHVFTVKGLDIAKVSKVVADMGKFMDLTKRLQEFMAGRPDSRPDLGAAWMELLTDEEVTMLSRRAEDRARR